MLKRFVIRIATLYAANGKFHLFVNSMMIGAGTGVSAALVGGIPLNKQGWLIAGGVVLGAVKAAFTAWLRDNVALASVQGAPATPAQAVNVAAVKDSLAEAAAASVKPDASK